MSRISNAGTPGFNPQGWEDKLADRAADTTYQNDSDVPIAINVSNSVDNSEAPVTDRDLILYVGPTASTSITMATGGAELTQDLFDTGSETSATAIIPVDHYYELYVGSFSGSIQTWNEMKLR